MTEEQRAVIKGWYEKMDPNDEPPFPAEGMRSFMEALSMAHRGMNVDQNIDLVATVGPAGDVTTVQAFSSSKTVMTKYAAALLYRTKFKPAICAGKPCQMDFPVRVHFEGGFGHH